MNENQHITELLFAWNQGDKAVLNELLPLVDRELRRIAHNYMRRERSNHTLQTTALINEAFIQLLGQQNTNWQNRVHFFALSAQIMRHILIKYARDRVADKRGGGAKHLNIDEAEILSIKKSDDLIALDEALERLALIDETKSRIVELRYFGGLTLEETAEVLGLAAITVSVKWRLARAWLRNEIRDDSFSL